MDAPKLKNDDLIDGSDEIDLDPHLSRALNFSHRDLLENRDGYLSKTQREFLQEEVSTHSGYAVLLSIVLILIAAVILALSANQASEGYILALTAATFIGYYLVKETMKWRTARRDLEESIVYVVESEVALKINAGKYPSFEVRAGKVVFKVPKEKLLAFHDGEPYRIYYVPHSKMILSAEPLKAKRQAE